MTTPDAADDQATFDPKALHRAWRFEDRIRVRCATRTEPFPWGTLLLNEDFRRVWDFNFLRVDRPDGAEPRQLISEADRLLGGAGYTHRQVEVLGEKGSRLAPGFLEQGWNVFQALYMVQNRQPADRIASGAAGEITWGEARPAVELQTQREPFAKDAEVARQLVERADVLAKATNQRFFGAKVDGKVVSYASLYSDGQVAQIEDVGTLEEHRKKGLSRATLQAALDVAHGEGHDMIFLVADHDDWPKAFYADLGFDPVGVCYSFRREPPSDAPAL